MILDKRRTTDRWGLYERSRYYQIYKKYFLLKYTKMWIW